MREDGRVAGNPASASLAGAESWGCRRGEGPDGGPASRAWRPERVRRAELGPQAACGSARAPRARAAQPCHCCLPRGAAPGRPGACVAEAAWRGGAHLVPPPVARQPLPGVRAGSVAPSPWLHTARGREVRGHILRWGGFHPSCSWCDRELSRRSGTP